MAKAKLSARSAQRSKQTLSYQLLRNTTSPDEIESGVKSFVANLPVFEILKIGTEENLRGYLAEHNPRRRNRVHDAIRRTIDTLPGRFITRNSGFVITASEVEVDDNKKIITLVEPSVINGAQSQGEIRKWVRDTYGDEVDQDEDPPFHIRAEIIVDPDGQQVVETAIARNTATPVKSISQAGSRGHLEDLEISVRKKWPKLQIRKSESDEVGEDVYDTRKLLQFCRLLMPTSVSGNDTAAEKLRAYKNPEQCLTDFSNWYETKGADPDAKRKYDFTVSIAPIAIQEYEHWEAHDGWNGHRVWTETKKGGRACRRDEASNRIIWVSPGLVFPILGAISEFAAETQPGKWVISKPRMFSDSEMIARAVAQFRTVDSDPMLMGRSAGVYDALRIYPSTIVSVMKQISAELPAG
jgi:hypothetical protein